MTIKVTAVGVPRVVVEHAFAEGLVTVDDWTQWSLRVHNAGETGIMGGAIQNYSGPGSVVVKWQGKEYELPPSTTQCMIISYTDAKPNCTRLETMGEIKYKTPGSYRLRILGVHRDNTSWFLDDHREFAVEAGKVVKSIWEMALDLWLALELWQKATIVAIPTAVVGVYGIVKAVKKRE